MKGHDPGSVDRLVGDDHFEFVTVLVRNEQVQLNRAFALSFLPGANEEEAETPIPTRRLPRAFKVVHLPIQSVPSFPPFDHSLQFGETLERNADAQLHLLFVQGEHNVVVEEGAVHSYFDHRVRKNAAEFSDTMQNKLFCAVGVVNVTWAMMEVEDLSCLGDGRKERIVASCSLLLSVEAHRRSFREPTG